MRKTRRAFPYLTLISRLTCQEIVEMTERHYWRGGEAYNRGEGGGEAYNRGGGGGGAYNPGSL